jgi:IS30 family transposase
MARGKPITPEERERMATMVRDGASIYSVARDLDRSPSGVSAAVREQGVDLRSQQMVDAANMRMTQQMVDGRDRWNVQARTQLGARIFDKVSEVLPDTTNPKDLRDLAVTFGVMTDKMRLESDMSTQNIAVQHSDKLTDDERSRIRAILEGD